jgi:hypothetical protein
MDRTRRTTGPLLGAIAAVLVLIAVACGGNESTTTTAPAGDAPSTTENPYGEALAIDPPGPDEVVLTVTGPAGSQTYTMGQLTEAATTTLTVDEPFVNQRIEFTGIPMAELFAPAGIQGATVVETVALNDYVYSAPANVFTDSNAIVAVGQAGGDIPIEQGGPIRIVFPDGSPGASNLDAWNWSLERIEAE